MSGLVYSLLFDKGSYKFELFGASGGYTTRFKVNNPGLGGYTHGILSLSEQKNLYLVVGGMGGNSTATDVGTAGFNGGGAGSRDEGTGDCNSAGGGGATDLRLEKDNLLSRIMVAGGGGSAGCYLHGGRGGDGGGLVAMNGNNVDNNNNILGGKGGTQETGYDFGYGGVGDGSNKEKMGESGGSGGLRAQG